MNFLNINPNNFKESELESFIKQIEKEIREKNEWINDINENWEKYPINDDNVFIDLFIGIFSGVVGSFFILQEVNFLLFILISFGVFFYMRSSSKKMTESAHLQYIKRKEELSNKIEKLEDSLHKIKKELERRDKTSFYIKSQ